MKYPREKLLDPRNTHEKKIETHEIPTKKILGPTKGRWHGGTRPTRPTMARDPRNLAHSILNTVNSILWKSDGCVSTTLV